MRWLTPVRYDEDFFREEWFENWERLAPVLSTLLWTPGRWKSFLDFGCGPGVMIDYMNDRGFYYVGCDLSPEPKALYLQRYGKYPDRYVSSLEEVSPSRFDLLVMFDVLEHLRDTEIEPLLRRTAPIPEILANISRARGIPGHVNIKDDRSWIAFFQEQGFAYDAEGTLKLRKRYLEQRPRGPDLWHKNLFLLRRYGNDSVRRSG